MSFGYIGDTSTSVKQQVKNKGILTTQESFDLERQGFLGGSLELIESQTVTGSAGLEFTNIKEDVYDVHLIKFHSVHTTSNTSNTDYRLRVSTNGGTSYVAVGYDNASQSGTAAGSFSENRSTSATELFLTFTSDNATNNANANGYSYLYNLGNSSKYSFQTYHTATQINNSTFVMFYGGGVYDSANTVNALQITTRTGFNFDGTFELFGIKQI